MHANLVPANKMKNEVPKQFSKLLKDISRKHYPKVYNKINTKIK